MAAFLAYASKAVALKYADQQSVVKRTKLRHGWEREEESLVVSLRASALPLSAFGERSQLHSKSAQESLCALLLPGIDLLPQEGFLRLGFGCSARREIELWRVRDIHLALAEYLYVNWIFIGQEYNITLMVR